MACSKTSPLFQIPKAWIFTGQKKYDAFTVSVSGGVRIAAPAFAQWHDQSKESWSTTFKLLTSVYLSGFIFWCSLCGGTLSLSYMACPNFNLQSENDNSLLIQQKGCRFTFTSVIHGAFIFDWFIGMKSCKELFKTPSHCDLITLTPWWLWSWTSEQTFWNKHFMTPDPSPKLLDKIS